MLAIQNVTFDYGQKRIFEDLHFTLGFHETAALLGPSGCGKTTLFHLIAGMLPVQQGKIIFQKDDKKMRSSLLTYMMQKDLLLPWKTTLENVLVVQKFVSKDKRLLEKKALHLLKRMDLLDTKDLYPHQLSGGMRQRVALARALLLERPLLLLDEPFAHVDYEQRLSLYALLQELQQEQGFSMLLITHDQQDALHLADTVYEFKRGSLIKRSSFPLEETELVCQEV